MNRNVKEITSIPFEQSWFKDIGQEPLMRYSVMVRKVTEDGSLGETLIGNIVTHLSPEDWCELNGYWLQQTYPITKRCALRGEVTELF